jgi:hypothetical protein
MRRIFILGLLLLLALPMSHVFGDLKEGLVGLWLFDEQGGDVIKDSSENGNDGTITGNVKHVKGKFGNALEFPGTNNVYAEVPDAAWLDLENFTLMAWVYSEKITGKWQIVASKENRGPTGRNYGMFLNINTGVLHYSFTRASSWRSYNAKTPLTDGKWHHVAITFDGKSFKAYVDGTVDAETQISDKPDMHDNSIFIGGCPLDGSYALTGMVDEVAVYNRALSEGEIKEAMEGFSKVILGVDPNSKLTTMWGAMKAR